jgi:hypothetical protein
MWPHLTFPEGDHRGTTGSYDHSTGYLNAPTLKYSFGFTTNVHPDYPLRFETEPVAQWLTEAAAVGFRALVVDRYALQGDRKVTDVEPLLAPVLGPPTMVSKDNRYAYYDLRAFVSTVAPATLDDLKPKVLAPS